jgi:hypothetical protein
MEWAYKSHNDTIVMPDDFVVSEIVKSKPKVGASFENMVEEFEKTHCKVINKSMFVKITDDKSVLMTLKQLEMFELFFLRPSMSVVLEYGWGTGVRNKSKAATIGKHLFAKKNFN